MQALKRRRCSADVASGCRTKIRFVPHCYTHLNSTVTDPTGNTHWLVKRALNGLFTGQQHILDEMKACLLESESASTDDVSAHYVLCGIGGVGKSEIALQFAHRNRQSYWGVFWIDCSTDETVGRSFGQVAKKCGWDTGSGKETTEDTICELSNSQFPWLLVLDNCDDSDVDYSQFIPNAEVGTLVITTRLEDVRTQYGIAGSHRLEGLGEAHAVELLFKAAGVKMPASDVEDTAARSIVEQLGWHTLAVTVAASLIKRTYSLEDYSIVLREKFAELLRTQPRQARSTYGTIEATFEVTAQRLLDSEEECDAHALQLLSLLAFLGRANLSEEVFTRAWKWGKENRNNPDECDQEVTDFDIDKLSTRHFEFALCFAWAMSSDIVLFRQARARLDELSLVSCTQSADGMVSTSMHPVIHSWARNRLQESEQLQAWQVAAATLALSCGNDFGWQRFTYQLQPHLEYCYYSRPPAFGDSVPLSFCCQTLRAFWWQLQHAENGRIVPILADLQRLWPPSTTISEGCLDNVTMGILSIQSATLNWLERHDESLKIQRILHRAYEESRGRHDKAAQAAKLNLADTLCTLCRFDEAALILESLRQIHIESPRAHFMRLEALSRLGSVYTSLDKPEKAIVLLEEVLEIGKEPPGGDLGQRLQAQHTLAGAYRKLNQLPKAIPLMEDIVRTKAGIFHPWQVERWSSEANLAYFYAINRQMAEARAVLDQIGPYVNHQRLDFRDHYHTTDAMILFEQGQVDQAELVQEAIVRRVEQILPREDPTRCLQEFSLVTYQLRSRNYKKARLQLDSMRAEENILCEQERSRLVGLEEELLHLEQDVANKHYEKGEVDLAVPLQKEVVQRRTRSLHMHDEKRFESECILALYFIEARKITDARHQLDKMLLWLGAYPPFDWPGTEEVLDKFDRVDKLVERLDRLKHKSNPDSTTEAGLTEG